MMVVIFELEPAEGRAADYFSLAAALKEELQTIDGFVSVERFESLSTPGRFLSLSVWRDEAAVRRWRNLPAHREAQRLGRAGIFRDYRLRVAEVVRDYGLAERTDAPADSRAAHPDHGVMAAARP
ncbi:MAG TPA: antibiotic biosynthesis monooxygenase [Burkholderiaceae bacterium]|nr:antibiotic biosynthesis monooxygenase [Burkholderiaceae bacterium]